MLTCILVGYGPQCLEFSEITNCRYLWKGLTDLLFFCCYVLFCVGTVRHRLSVNQIVRCYKLKNLKTTWGIKLIFCFNWSYEKYVILGYDSKILLANQLAGLFTFYLFDLLILILGVHCYIALLLNVFREDFKNFR